MQITLQIPRSSVTVLVGVNIAIWIVITLLAFIVGPRNYEAVYNQLLISFGALSGSYAIQLGEVWRMVSSLFLHVDILHIGFNMFALFQLGKVIEQYYGGKMLIAFYVICGIGGSVASVLFLDPRIPTVGASGAVFGLMGVLIAGSIKKTRYGLDLPFKPMDILPLAVYALLFGLIPGSGVNNFAHIGGLVTGLVLGFLFKHQLSTYKNKNQERAASALYYISLVILLLTIVAVAINIFGTLFR